MSFQLYEYKAIGATDTTFIEVNTDIDSMILSLLNCQHHVILPEYVFNHSHYLNYLSSKKLDNQFKTIYLYFKNTYDNPMLSTFIEFIMKHLNIDSKKK